MSLKNGRYNVVTNIRIYRYEVRYYIFIQNENGHGLCNLQSYAHYFQEMWFKKVMAFCCHQYINYAKTSINRLTQFITYFVCTTIQNHLKLWRLWTLLHHISTICIACLFLIGAHEFLRSHTSWRATECFH